LELTSRVASLLPNLEDEQYAAPLRDVTLVKLMLQLCQVSTKWVHISRELIIPGFTESNDEFFLVKQRASQF
jgi:hypothetical protein